MRVLFITSCTEAHDEQLKNNANASETIFLERRFRNNQGVGLFSESISRLTRE
jgi:hypothetical protein